MIEKGKWEQFCESRDKQIVVLWSSENERTGKYTYLEAVFGNMMPHGRQKNYINLSFAKTQLGHKFTKISHMPTKKAEQQNCKTPCALEDVFGPRQQQTVESRESRWFSPKKVCF